jgi:hypothetical protein
VKVDAYLEALADERKRLLRLKIEDDASLDVYAALGLSARRLAEEKPALEARWRLLAVFPASFDAAAAAAVWEAETDDPLGDLGELRRRSIVLWDAADDRWRLHDLMRNVARVPLDGQDEALAARLEAARARHARHYCDVLAAADDLFLKGGEGVLAGLALYDLEQRNIAAGQAWATARSEQDEAAARLAADYANAGAYVLMLRLHPRERIAWLEAQREALRPPRRPAGRGQRARQSGHRLPAPRRAAAGDRVLRAAARDHARDRRPAGRGQRARQSGLGLRDPRRAAVGDRVLRAGPRNHGRDR